MRRRKLKRKNRAASTWREPAKVTLGMPCGDHIHRDCVIALQDLASYLSQNPPEGLEQYAVTFYSSSMLVKSRMIIAQKAIDAGSTHLLMIDSDMSFPPDILHRLLAWDKPFVAAAALIRRPPFCINAETEPGVKMRVPKDGEGLVPVHSVGQAVALVKTEVFRKLDRPWFDMEYMPEREPECEFFGEDMYFCKKVREAGFPLYVDTALTRDVVHIGSFPYRASLAERET